MLSFDDDKFYDSHQELIKSHLNKLAFGQKKTSERSVLGCRYGGNNFTDITKASIFSVAYTGLMRFYLIYVLEWNEEEAMLHVDEIFDDYGFKNVAEHGFISLPLKVPFEEGTEIFRIKDRKDIIRWVYGINSPKTLVEILEDILERNLKNKKKQLLKYNIDIIKKERLYSNE